MKNATLSFISELFGILFMVWLVWYALYQGKEIKTLKSEITYCDQYLWKHHKSDFTSKDDFEDFKQFRRECAEHSK